jgi:hypothetical protein
MTGEASMTGIAPPASPRQPRRESQRPHPMACHCARCEPPALRRAPRRSSLLLLGLAAGTALTILADAAIGGPGFFVVFGL